jgi:hypothetical protein
MARCRLSWLAVLGVAILVIAGCSSDSAKPVAGLESRSEQIGELEVTVTPTQLDDQGAAFTVVFDTHTGAPTIDVAANAALAVDGTAWTSPVWSGDGPDGHHRSGTLRFTPAGPARGEVRLSISGLAQPLALSWQLSP